MVSRRSFFRRGFRGKKSRLRCACLARRDLNPREAGKNLPVCLEILNDRASRPARAHTRAPFDVAATHPPSVPTRPPELPHESARRPDRATPVRERAPLRPLREACFTGPLDDSLVRQAPGHHVRGHVAHLGGLLRHRHGRARLVPHLPSGASRGSAAFTRRARRASPCRSPPPRNRARPAHVHALRFKLSPRTASRLTAETRPSPLCHTATNAGDAQRRQR